ncbi:hypothetical protein REC12_25475 [Desulfosporosinus sp. PR]|uniref:hypothetical protein n=1 Tax=Candidatus Desulfosporosinus nitrosoreducens TaxID=3401928 RepID=UPI0027EFC1E1|nr:hypothetical protein [Desulfosporosinus sp. PR]MDQ7096950.1 hypothetical protein [Desulfosporosinus sp. PR]
MTTEETTILTSTLDLSSKVLSNDLNVEDSINAINNVTANTDEFNPLIKEDVNNIIEKSTTTNKNVTAKIIDGLTVLTNKDALLALLDARTLDLSNTVAVKVFIDNALSSTVKDFNYFSLVVKMAILISDKDRIISIINKIQSLGAA